MKKFFWVLWGIIIALVGMVVVFLVTLPFTISPIVKTAASVGGPKVLGVPVSVGNVSLKPLTGSMTITEVKLGNPKGFSSGSAFAVDKVDVALNIRSLLSGTIVVRKIAIDAPAISYESRDSKSNFDAILANAKKSEDEEKAKKPTERKAGKKLIIEEFVLNGAKVSYTSAVTFGKPVMLPLPMVMVKDIGKDAGGASAVEAVTQVVNAIVSSLVKAVAELAEQASDLLKSAGGSVTDAAKSTTDAAKGASDAAKDAEDAVKDAAKSLKKLFK